MYSKNLFTTLSKSTSSTGASVASPNRLCDPSESRSSVKHASSSFQSSFSQALGPSALNVGLAGALCLGPGVSNTGLSKGSGSLNDALSPALVNDASREGVCRMLRSRCSTVCSAC